MKSPLEDSIWGASYGSVAAVQAAFDRLGADYHRAILESGAPAGAASAFAPFLASGSQGLDLGCGSGALGLALRDAGVAVTLDGLDLSPVMLQLARASHCYRQLEQANVLDPGFQPRRGAYDFAISMGLIGDYVPYYLGLPLLVDAVVPGGLLGYAVESRSTPSRALDQLARTLELTVLSETILPVPQGRLTAQEYYFFVARVRAE